tara:strand:+ start:217 stop:783 length:567 start_codon:yes stop_codon:yes gene_type:complete
MTLSLARLGLMGAVVSSPIELIETINISDATSAEFDSIGNYEIYRIELWDIDQTIEGNRVVIKLYEASTSSYETAGVHHSGNFQIKSTSGQSNSKSTTFTGLPIARNGDNANYDRQNAYAMIYNAKNSSRDTHINYHSIGNVNGVSTTGMWIGGGYLPQQSEITKFKLVISSGTFSATAKLYGINDLS